MLPYQSILQYLLNTTIIWLLGLLCFDILLRRETYHSYNRAYLLLTLIAGIFMPLYTRPAVLETAAAAQVPLFRLDMAKIAVTEQLAPATHNTTVATTASWSWTTLLLWVYIAGATVSLLFLLREILVLARYYHTGKKTKESTCTIIETYRDHGPFSIGRYIFVSSKKNYDNEQWQIVLQHEQMHSRLLHLIDMILLQIVQVVFWFHPLVYLYRSRLLMVHEYQADAAAQAQPLRYGHFLVEQALLQRGPLPAHSFNRSPIKNRLRMLTRKTSPGLSGLRFGLIVPVLLAGVLCCAKGYQLHERKKISANMIEYKGNKFKLSDTQRMSVATTNPKTGKEEITEIEMTPYVLEINGQKIADRPTVKNMPVYMNGSLEEQILDAVKPELAKLPDAENYVISVFDPIVDQKGMLAYYTVRGLEQYFQMSDPDNGRLEIPKDIKAAVDAKVNMFLDGDHQFQPATRDGKNIACFAGLKALQFSVKNHQVTYHIL